MSTRPPSALGTTTFPRLLIQGAHRIAALYTGSAVTWTGIYALPLAIGAVIAALLDRSAEQPFPSTVWWLLAIIVALMVLRAVLLFVGLQLTFTLIYRTSAWLKVSVLGTLLRRPSQPHEHRNGDVLNRLRDDTDEIGGLLEWTTDLIYRSVLTVVAVVVLAMTDLLMTIPLVLLLGGVLAAITLKKRVAEAQAEVRAQQGHIGGAIADTLTGVRDLRLSGTLERQLARLSEDFAVRRNHQVRHQLYADLLSDLFRNLVMVGTAVVLLAMTARVSDGQFSLGTLTLFLTYSSWLGQQMYFFGMILARYQGGAVSYQRLVELAPPVAPSLATTVPSRQPLRELRAVELSCRSPSGGAAPEPVTFAVRPGEIVAITGELGSGKSTLVRGLLGLGENASGSLLWNDVIVLGDATFLQTPRVSYARQSSLFVRGTIRENLVMGTSGVTDAHLAAAMEAVGLHLGSQELPLGLDTWIESGDAGQLSGGQRQRLTLARMVCQPAELYVVDDCDSAIDAATARTLWATLPVRWRGAWIVVSHNPDLIASATTVLEIARAERLAPTTSA